MVKVKNVREEEVQCSKVEYYLMPVLDCRKYASALLTPYFHVKIIGLHVCSSSNLLFTIRYKSFRHDVQKHIAEGGYMHII
jgi:hypothetical protein